MGNIFQDPQPGNTILTTDLKQVLHAFSATTDVGPLSLFAPIAAPSAPALAAGVAGTPSGTYECVVVGITGYVTDSGTLVLQGFAPSASASVTVTSQQIDWTLPAPPAGVIARALYRTVAGGAAGSEKFAAFIGDATTLSYSDDVADASLGTGMPTSSSTPPVIGNALPSGVPSTNSTGSSIAVSYGASAPANPADGALWVDTSASPAVLKLYASGAWGDVSPPVPTASMTVPGTVLISSMPTSGDPTATSIDDTVVYSMIYGG